MARKPNPISEKEINEIATLIKNKGSIKIIHPVDCKLLSNHIFTITGKYISSSTIKRFFGFYPSSFSPSYDTINILKRYIELEIINKNNNYTELVVSFFNPLHFESINYADKSFQASCRVIAIHLRNNPNLLEKVMDKIAMSELGRRFYFDLFPDYEILCTVQYKGFEKYLIFEKSYEGQMFAKCILFLKSFFESDISAMKIKWMDISKFYKKNKKLHPFVLGRYFQIQLIAQFNFNPIELKKLKKEIFNVEKKQPRNGLNNFMEFPGFHYFTCDGLWHVNAYDELLELSNIALHDFDKHKEFIWKGYYDQLYLYKGLALANLGKKSEAKKLLKEIKTENFYFPTKSYFEKLYNELKINSV